MLLLTLTIILSRNVETLGYNTVSIAKQASWLSPLVSFAVFIAFIFILNDIYKKHSDSSFMEIVYSVIGKIPGKILVLFYSLFLVLFLSLHIRYYAERLTSAVNPYINMNFLILIMLTSAAIILRSGIVTIARMNEIIIIVVLAVFFGTFFLAMPNMNVKFITPISTMDIIPIIKGSIFSTSFFGYIFFMFFISEQINNKEKMIKQGIIFSAFLLMLSMSYSGAMLALYSPSLVVRLLEPGSTSIKLISIFSAFAGVEPLGITLWIMADFILIAVLVYIILSMIKSVFCLADIKPFISVFLVIEFFLSIIISSNRFELDNLWITVMTPVSCVLEFGVPLFIYVVGKVRKIV